MTKSWVVHKFGGTSVANAERYQHSLEIVKTDRAPRKAIVVSAMSGITDKLIRLVELAKQQDQLYLSELEAILALHLSTLSALAHPDQSALRDELYASFHRDTQTIRDLLKAVSLSRSYAETTLELIAGHGELWSAQLLNVLMRSRGMNSAWLDAREVLVVTQSETGPLIDWELSQKKIDAHLAKEKAEFLAITGFIASTHEGIATTLKRNGSDFSASIFGALLNASCITIWTDVDGVLSADPRRVPEAVVLDEMSYSEAMELAYFGAKVIHPHTMAPAKMKGIDLWIRNSFNPAAPGTKIYARSPGAVNSNPVKGFTTVDRVALINLEGTGLIGIPGSASRLFGALKEVSVSVIMISQASSEHSICFAVPEAQGQLAKTTVGKAFFSEIHQGLIQSVDCKLGMSILAAVGDNMVNVPGVAAKFFQVLGRAGISIRAIAQGSSERNISVVIDQAQATKALRAAHAGFYLSDHTLSVGVIGPGLIGSSLIKQLEGQAERLTQDFKIDLRIRAVADSSKMISGERLRFDSPIKARLAKEGRTVNLEEFTAHLQADHIPHAVIIDCSSSEKIAALYPEWLRMGIHIITPNKKANSGSLKNYQSLKKAQRESGSHYLYEATVGAGLPIITTLRDLILTGDEIIQIEGILSGTLSFLFNRFTGDQNFSEIVSEAQKLGFTEPNPRDDLSGSDVARKLIILAREAGMNLEMTDIKVEPVDQSDEELLKRLRAANDANEVLRYVGNVSKAGASVSLKNFPKTHAFSRLSGTDNIIAFTTRRYHTQALIVQGPGAGPEVTAGGIFGDLLRLAAYIGAAT